MIHIKAPNNFNLNTSFKVFLAGSIEMDKAIQWQQEIVEYTEKESNKLVLLNPRRDNWNSNWKQDKNNFYFKQQVEWELNALEASDLVIFYFQPGTISPISLLELGLFKDKSIVCCPKEYFRKGNIDIVCEKYNITLVETLEELRILLVKKFKSYESAIQKI